MYAFRLEGAYIISFTVPGVRQRADKLTLEGLSRVQTGSQETVRGALGQLTSNASV